MRVAGTVIWGVLIGTIITAGAAMAGSEQKATFAGGCFWGIEKYFGEVDGVIATRVGYTGGRVKNPTYEAVCTGTTGHAEAIEITYDPARTTYEELVIFFFTHHDPTQLNRQGNDIGTQYRSTVFYHDEAQKAAARKAIEALDRSGVFKRPVVTTLEPAADFYAAEAYHQKYLKKNPNGYCSIVPQPRKVEDILRGAFK